MHSKGKKIKINIKELIQRQSSELSKKTEKSPDNGENSNLNQPHNLESDEESKRSLTNQSSKRNGERGRKKKQGDTKVTLKQLIKQATNTLFEQRKKMSFPNEAVQQINKFHHSVRIMALFQKIHTHYFKIFDSFKENGFAQMADIMNHLYNELMDVMKEFRQYRTQEFNNRHCISNEDYNKKLLRFYNMELKAKDEQIKRKKAFRQNAKPQFASQIRNIQLYIKENARLVSQVVLRQRFQSIIDKVEYSNGEIIARKEKQCDRDMKLLFAGWRKIKQEKMMMDKLKRAQRIERDEENRRQMADKFPNLMGILFNPFTVYEKVI